MEKASSIPMAETNKDRSPDTPTVSKEFFVIVNREHRELAAVISSYLHRKGMYLPLFEFPFVSVPKPAEVTEDFSNDFMSIDGAIDFSNYAHNALLKIGGTKNLILAGLTNEQRSYLNFLDKFPPIEIKTVADVDVALGKINTSPKEFLRCTSKQILEGLFIALINGRKLQIEENAGEIKVEIDTGQPGLMLIEDVHAVSTVTAINYAACVDATIRIVAPLQKDEDTLIRVLIEEWRATDSADRYNSIRDFIYDRVRGIYFQNYAYCTFFTTGIPYSLYMDNAIPCSYVHLWYRSDFFIFNSLFFEHYIAMPSSIVFSSPDFKNIDETENVIKAFETNQYYVRELRGTHATASNLDLHIRDFAYDFLHISSHGGKADGRRICIRFTGDDQHDYELEYDTVVTFAPMPGEALIPVAEKWFPRKLNGYVLGSKDLHDKGYPASVYDQIYQVMAKKDQGKIVSDEPNDKVADSCSIVCSDFNYQAMFDRLAHAYNSPIVFNNSCWSWSEVSQPFLHKGARGYIGTLFKIGTKEATLGANTFYDHLFDEPVIESVHRANEAIQASKYKDVYVCWGLPITRLKKGNSIKESREEVVKRSLKSFYDWSDRKGSASEMTNKQIELLATWNANQLEEYFKNDLLEKKKQHEAKNKPIS